MPPDTMGRLYATAEAMRQFPGVDEPLIINASEVDHVAEYLRKIRPGIVAAKARQLGPGLSVQELIQSSDLVRILRAGKAMVFGRRIEVI